MIRQLPIKYYLDYFIIQRRVSRVLGTAYKNDETNMYGMAFGTQKTN